MPFKARAAFTKGNPFAYSLSPLHTLQFSSFLHKQQLIAQRLLASENNLTTLPRKQPSQQLPAYTPSSSSNSFAQSPPFLRLVQVTAQGPHFNMFALVIVRPSDNASLQISLFKENVR